MGTIYHLNKAGVATAMGTISAAFRMSTCQKEGVGAGNPCLLRGAKFGGSMNNRRRRSGCFGHEVNLTGLNVFGAIAIDLLRADFQPVWVQGGGAIHAHSLPIF